MPSLSFLNSEARRRRNRSIFVATIAISIAILGVSERGSAQSVPGVSSGIVLGGYDHVLSQKDISIYRDQSIATAIDGSPNKAGGQQITELACAATVYAMIERGRGWHDARPDDFYPDPNKTGGITQGAVRPKYVGADEPIQPRDILNSLGRNQPVVLHSVGAGKSALEHFVLVVGIEANAGGGYTLKINDPYVGKQRSITMLASGEIKDPAEPRHNFTKMRLIDSASEATPAGPTVKNDKLEQAMRSFNGQKAAGSIAAASVPQKSAVLGASKKLTPSSPLQSNTSVIPSKPTSVAVPPTRLEISPQATAFANQIKTRTPEALTPTAKFVVPAKPLYPVPQKSKEAEAIGDLVDGIHTLNVLAKMASQLRHIDAAPLAAATREQIKSQVLKQVGTEIVTDKVVSLVQSFVVKKIAERTGWDAYQIENAINTGRNLATGNLKGQLMDSAVLLAQSIADTISTAKNILPSRDKLSAEQLELVQQDPHLRFMYALQEGRYLGPFSEWLKATAGESRAAGAKLREKLDQFVAYLQSDHGSADAMAPGGSAGAAGRRLNAGPDVRIGNLNNSVHVGGAVSTSATSGRSASTRIGSTIDGTSGGEVSGSYFTDIGGSVVNQGGTLEINPIQSCETRRNGQCCIEIHRNHCVLQKYVLSLRAFDCAPGFERDGRTCFRYSDKDHSVRR